MDNAPITIRKYTDFDEIKADEYRYWPRRAAKRCLVNTDREFAKPRRSALPGEFFRTRPGYERLDAVDEMIETAYALKGWEIEPDAPRLQRPFVRLPVPWR